MDFRDEAKRRLDEPSCVGFWEAERGGACVVMPDWIEGLGENGTKGEAGGCWRFDMAAEMLEVAVLVLYL